MYIADDELYLAWNKLLRALISTGHEFAPRGLGTKEILGVTFRVNNGRQNILYHPVRDLNYKFMVAEWLWIVSGSDDLEEIAHYNDQMRRFSDDGAVLYGAYGPRLGTQFDWIGKRLAKDTFTRQAVATIWRPYEMESKDVPCTIALQFIWRNNKMNLIVTMRSSDAWLGLPYDFFTFSQILNSVAGQFSAEVGFVQFNLGSSHLYNVNLEKTLRLTSESYKGYTFGSPALTSGAPGVLLEAFKCPHVPHNVTQQPWRTYADVLLSPRNDALKHLTSKP